MNPARTLNNVTVLTFESRMADITAELLQRYGANTISAPSMQEAPLEDHQAVFVFADELLAGKVDTLICTTGGGTDMMIRIIKARHEWPEILQALSGITVVSRGAKPSKVLHESGIPITIKVPEPNTWREILRAMSRSEQASRLRGRTVAIQEYGEPNEELNKALQKQGVRLLRVPVYRWTLPDDTKPLKNGIQAIIKGEVQIVLFTSKTQLDHAMKVAAQESSRELFQRALNKTWVASIGPVCTKGLKKHGIDVHFEPSRPKLRIFINEVAEHASQWVSDKR